jgi:hypothetical protein
MPARVAAWVVGLQALTLLVFTGFYLVELFRGATDNSTRAVMSMVLFLLFAVGLGFLSRGLWRGAHWARTPTLVWLFLLVPVGLGMFQSGLDLVGALVLVSAVAGIVAVVKSGRVAGAED